ncbi:hypothetical protein BTVI_02472 [Pitangus sulphuratus]|nr:hypothetical protein BTVI_02472 [Pitangus sulphuratus]
MENFTLSEINWGHHTVGSTWARKFLENLDDNFMEQDLRERKQKDAPLNLKLVNRIDLMSKVDIGGHLGHSKHKMIKFKPLLTGGKMIAKSQLWT